MREEDLLSSLTLQRAGSTSISIWGKDQESPFPSARELATRGSNPPCHPTAVLARSFNQVTTSTKAAPLSSSSPPGSHGLTVAPWQSSYSKRSPQNPPLSCPPSPVVIP